MRDAETKAMADEAARVSRKQIQYYKNKLLKEKVRAKKAKEREKRSEKKAQEQCMSPAPQPKELRPVVAASHVLQSKWNYERFCDS